MRPRAFFCLLLALAPTGAAAQFSFFGRSAEEAPVPPGSIPGARPSGGPASGGPTPGGPAQGPVPLDPSGQLAPSLPPPPPPKPVVLRAPTEEGVLNQD